MKKEYLPGLMISEFDYLKPKIMAPELIFPGPSIYNLQKQ
jgi:hypothetical protein